MMELCAVRKSFGSRIAVDSLSFVAQNGIVTGLLGPNGAGKTTSLRVVGGLVKPDAGTALVDGRDVVRDPGSARRALGVLPEEVGLYERLTVREHLEYAAALRGLTSEESPRRIADVMARLGLEAIAGQRAGGLSFGQKRRVALARAILHEPRNAILDEPTNALDVLSIRQVRAEIRRLAREGVAVIVSSHVMPEVMATCDRVVILSNGRVAAEGTPADLLARTGGGSLEDAFVELVHAGGTSR